MDRILPKIDPDALVRFLAVPEGDLTAAERALRTIAVLRATPMPCPMCFELVNLYEAGNETQAVGEPYDGPFVCPNCDTELARMAPFYLVPIMPGWCWRRKHPIPGRRGRTEGT